MSNNKFAIGDKVVWHTSESGVNGHDSYASSWLVDKHGVIVKMKTDEIDRIWCLLEFKDESRQWGTTDRLEIDKHCGDA